MLNSASHCPSPPSAPRKRFCPCSSPATPSPATPSPATSHSSLDAPGLSLQLSLLVVSGGSLFSLHPLKMRRSATSLLRSIGCRAFSSSEASASDDKIVASVLFERLPVVIPKMDPVVYAFQEFAFRWGQQYRRKYPDDVLGKGEARGKGDYQIDYVPAPRITEADKTNDRKSLKRALDRRLYLLLYGTTYGANSQKPVWHFPEKVYENEDTLRLCAESALKFVLGGLHHTYFVGNAPFAHMSIQATEISPESPSFKRFFFKSQVIGTSKLNIGRCEDHVWVTKDELMEYFPEQSEFLNKMIIS